MTDTRARTNWRRRATRAVRRLPLRPLGLAALAAACAFDAASGGSLAGALALAAFAALLLDRFAWRHTRMAGLRTRYRALGQRAEALDERLHALRESEAAHRALTETFGDLVAQTRGGAIVFANAGFRHLFGETGSLPVAFEGDAAQGEDEVETADDARILRWRAMPALDARGRAVTRWIARDVTATVLARREAEAAAAEAENRAEAKGRYLAVAAHEIRNPLAGIAGMADLLATGDLDAHARAQVTAITRSAGALGAVLDDLLDDARMDADRLSVENEPFDLGLLLEGVCELAACAAHEKAIDIAAHTVRHGPDAVPRLVTGDAGRVRQIVANLVSNAIKFTATGGVTVLARVEGGELRVDVTDTGPGLTAREAARVFDVFESGGDEEASRRLARRLGGVGLGLAISRRIAEAMGGGLDVRSRPDEGSTFTLALPCEAAESTESGQLAGEEVCLVTESRTLAGPLRRFVEERGGRLVVLGGEALARKGAWERGPLLIDEAVDAPLRDGAVALVRDASRREPAPRWLRLPWRAASLERALAGTAQVDADERCVLREAIDTGGPGARVLVAEDDPVTQLLATAVLERAGHRVTLAATGHDAARLYREAAESDAPFEAVLLDVNLTVSGETGMDGMAALRAVRQIETTRGLEPAGLHVVTADASEATRAEALDAGATGVLVKPVPVEVLAGLVPGPAAAGGQTRRSPAMR